MVVVAALLVRGRVRWLDFEDGDVQVGGYLIADADTVTYQVEEGQDLRTHTNSLKTSTTAVLEPVSLRFLFRFLFEPVTQAASVHPPGQMSCRLNDFVARI